MKFSVLGPISFGEKSTIEMTAKAFLQYQKNSQTIEPFESRSSVFLRFILNTFNLIISNQFVRKSCLNKTFEQNKCFKRHCA